MMNRCSLASTLATLATLGLGLASTAHADPGVVVLSFEGEMNLAVAARAEVVALVDRDYEVVTQRAWREALENGGRPGKAAWASASKETHVTAIIEGSASRARGGGVLRLAVRDARTGKLIEELTAPLGKEGLTDKARTQLEVSLTDALFAAGDGAPIEDHDAAEDDGEAPTKSRRVARRPQEEDDDEPAPSARPPRIAADVKVDVAASHATPEQDRLALFEAPRDDGSAAPAAPASPSLPRVPIADLSLSGSAISRQFGFTGADLPADYPGSTVTSLALSAAIYPTSKRDSRGRLNGLGVAATIARSVASEVPVALDGEVFDFPVTQSAWQLDAHYRHPAGAALIDGHVGYASLTHYVEDIPEDAALELDLLDAEYGYLDVGARVEIAAGPRTTLGFSASYLHMLQVGVVTDPDLLGNASAWGMQAGLDLKIQLGAGMFAGAGADYRRVSLVFDGDGELYQAVDVDDAKDTFLGGHLELGVLF
jgi:hypothetical protein